MGDAFALMPIMWSAGITLGYVEILMIRSLLVLIFL